MDKKKPRNPIKKDMESVWDNTEDARLLDDHDSDRIFQAIQNKKTSEKTIPVRSFKRGTRSLPFMVKAAASFLLLGTVAYFTSQFYIDRRPIETTDAIAMVEKTAPSTQRNHFFLEDGTEVWLNIGSKLTYPASFSASERRVRLEGEGFFEVAENKQKPFIVETEQLNVKVLGTAFNVEAREIGEKTSVSVVSGIVEVFASPQEEDERHAPGTVKTRLTKNDHVDFYHAEQEMKVSEITNPSLVRSWFTYKAQFDNSTMEDVANVLAKVYNVEITFENEALKACSLTMTLENNSLNKTLEIISKTNEINYSIENDKVRLTGTGCP